LAATRENVKAAPETGGAVLQQCAMTRFARSLLFLRR
jgi:hypothetical protein